MRMTKLVIAAIIGAGLSGGNSARAAFTLTFEGLQDVEGVGQFYNGGTGTAGSTGPNLGVSFSATALALIDSDAGGGGNFGNEPSPSTILFFASESSATLTLAAGFDTGFSFFYSAIFSPGSVTVYDGVNGTGNVLASLTLPVTPSGAGDPNGAFSPFLPIGVAFSGTARSVDFAGSAGNIGFDDITFGSDSPIGNPVPVPATAVIFAVGTGLAGLIARRRNLTVQPA